MEFERKKVGRKSIIKAKGVNIDVKRVSAIPFDWMIVFRPVPALLPPTNHLAETRGEVEICPDESGYYMNNLKGGDVQEECDIVAIWTIGDNVKVLMRTEIVQMRRNQLTADSLRDCRFLEESGYEVRGSMTLRKRHREVDLLDAYVKNMSKKSCINKTSSIETEEFEASLSVSGRFATSEERNVSDDQEDEVVPETDYEEEIEETIESEDEEPIENENEMTECLIVESMNSDGGISSNSIPKEVVVKKTKETGLDKRIIKDRGTGILKSEIDELSDSTFSFCFCMVNSDKLKFNEEIEEKQIVKFKSLVESGGSLENADPIIVIKEGPHYLVVHGRKRAFAYSKGAQRMINVAVMTAEEFQDFLVQRTMFQKKKEGSFTKEKLKSVRKLIDKLKVCYDEVYKWKQPKINNLFGENTKLSPHVFRIALDDVIRDLVFRLIGHGYIPKDALEKISVVHARNPKRLVNILQEFHLPCDFGKLKAALDIIGPDMFTRLQRKGVSPQLATDFLSKFGNHPGLEEFVEHGWPNRGTRKTKEDTFMDHWNKFLAQPPKVHRFVAITDHVSFDLAIVSGSMSQVIDHARNNDKCIISISIEPNHFTASTIVVIPDILAKNSATGCLSNSLTFYFSLFKNGILRNEKEFGECLPTSFRFKEVVTLEEIRNLCSNFNTVYIADKFDKKLIHRVVESCDKVRTPISDLATYIAKARKLKLIKNPI